MLLVDRNANNRPKWKKIPKNIKWNTLHKSERESNATHKEDAYITYAQTHEK